MYVYVCNIALVGFFSFGLKGVYSYLGISIIVFLWCWIPLFSNSLELGEIEEQDGKFIWLELGEILKLDATS